MATRYTENLVLLGPPGAGKGTQAVNLADYFQIPMISVGRLLREEVRARTAVGHQVAQDLAKGALVPDPVVLRLVENRLAMPDTARGFVLDGMPRTVEQARRLDAFLQRVGRKLRHVVLLVIPDDLAFERLWGRLICPDCGGIFQVAFNPPDLGETSPRYQATRVKLSDGSMQCKGCRQPIERERREDDRPEVVRERLAIYHQTIGPILSYYRSRGLLHEVDASGTPSEVFERILKALGASKRRDRRSA